MSLFIFTLSPLKPVILLYFKISTNVRVLRAPTVPLVSREYQDFTNVFAQSDSQAARVT